MAFLERNAADRKERFSLLMLDPGEIYFEDFSVFYYPWGIPEEEAIKRKQRGRLKICSKSIVFDPSEVQHAVIKFPFKDIGMLGRWSGPLLSRLDTKGEMLIIDPDQLVQLKEGNVIAPYVFRKVPKVIPYYYDRGVYIGAYYQARRLTGPDNAPYLPFTMAALQGIQYEYLNMVLFTVQEKEKYLFGLNYVSVDDCLPQISQLHRASTLPITEQAMMIRAIVHSRQARVKFDTSWLETLYEQIVMETEGDRISPLVTNPGRIMLTTARLYFQPFNNVETFPVVKIKLADVQRVIKRRFLLRHVGLEIYSSSSSCRHLYLVMKTGQERDKLCSSILSQPDVCLEDMCTENMTLRWQNGLVSNFDYLMYLNSMADRSINDLTQYPVLPWVVADYTSPTLDLDDPQTFRDLSKPIGALNDDRLQRLVDRCQDMPKPRFLYGSHYSTPGFVLFYLARVAPEYMLCLQNGRFDHPDRMFNSISDTWTNCLTSLSDFKELIPEFYTESGSFLQTRPGINFGVRHNGRPVGAVDLPPWASDGQDFVRKCRQALECEHVSKHLHQWIDLVFGFKQHGEEAEKANNLFYYLTYEGAVDLASIEDGNQKSALEAQIMEFGQTPKQLFTRPHPPRKDGVSLLASPAQTPSRSTELPATPGQGRTGTDEGSDEVASHCSTQEELVRNSQWRNLEKLQPELSHKLHKMSIEDISWGPDDKAIYSVSQDSLLKVYNVGDKCQQRSVPVSNMALSSCVLLDEAKTVILGCWDNYIYVYSLEYGRMLNNTYAHDDAVSCLCYQNNLLVSASWDTFAKLWRCEVENGIRMAAQLDLQAELEHDSGIQCASLTDSGKLLATGTVDGRLYVWDTQSQNPVFHIHSHSDVVHGVSFSGDGERLLSCGQDGFVRVVDITTSTELYSKDTGRSLRALAWDGLSVLVGGDDGTLLVLDLIKVQLLNTLHGHKDAVTCIAVSPTGRVATGSADRTVIVWKST